MYIDILLILIIIVLIVFNIYQWNAYKLLFNKYKVIQDILDKDIGDYDAVLKINKKGE